MLKKFKVKGFKGFGREVVLDFSNPNSYVFNSECVRNGVMRCAIIHGLNGSGKSNLGLALFDITGNLTDRNLSEILYDHYINADSESQIAEFEYVFDFDGCEVTYSYSKTGLDSFLSEKLVIDGRVVVDFDRADGHVSFFTTLPQAQLLDSEISDNHLSVLRYIHRNTKAGTDDDGAVFGRLMEFVDNMLYFKSLDRRFYIGRRPRHQSFLDDIIEDDKVADFQQFLRAAGVNCNLIVKEEGGKKVIYNRYRLRELKLSEVWSTGTNSLTLFYCWFQRIIKEGVSFLFIDEFDAFYHFRISKEIIRMLKESHVQFVVTTHNTANITNDLLRPDCYFLIDRAGIVSLANRTAKELRQAHNLEKMFKAGSFDDDNG